MLFSYKGTAVSRMIGYVLGLFFGFDLAFASSADPTFNTGIWIQSHRTHSRLIFRVDESVSAEWKENSKSFEILFKGITLSELGVTLGYEEAFRKNFENVRDSRLERLDFQEVREGLKVSGNWKFPTGSAALASPKMETFSYREKSPVQFVVDFWVKKGPTLIEVAAQRKQATRLAEIRKAEEEAKKRQDRKIAAARIKADAEDIGKFCRLPLNEKSDIFLRFYPLHEPVSFAKWIPKTTPDTHFPYFRPRTQEKDAQYVRLALELYKQGKIGLVIRTLEFFEKEHPRSSFRTEMKFLKANTLIKHGLHSEAESILNQLMTEARGSPVALHSGMFLAGKQMGKKLHLAALETFQWLIGNYPGHRLGWLFHMGAAESLFAMKQTERAAKEYQWIVESSVDEWAKAQAAFRIGDLYLDRFQYEQSLAAYFLSLDRFEDEAENFPPVHLNRAEALYWLDQNDRAEQAFKDFLEKFPAHPAGWRATFRLSEITGRKKGPEALAESRKWLFKTVNHYPYTAGSTLALLRLIPCGDHAGFSPEAADRFFSGEAAKFDWREEVAMNRYPELKALSHVRALSIWNRDMDAVDRAILALQSGKATGVRPELSNVLAILFRRITLRNLEQGKKLEALNYYREKVEQIPKSGVFEVSEDPDYLLKLSQAASDLGLGKFGEELLESYKAAKKKIREGREIATDSHGTDELERAIRESERQFAEAKALWIHSGIGAEQKIRELLEKVREESQFSFDREIILGLIDERKGKFAPALSHALRAQLLQPADRFDSDPRLECWLAGLVKKAGDPRVALEMYRNIEKHLDPGRKVASKQVPQHEDSHAPPKKDHPPKSSYDDPARVLGVPPVLSVEDTIMAQAEILESQSAWGEVALVYERAVEKGVGGNHARYGFARALLKTGDRQHQAKAYELLDTVVKSKEDDFWRKLAQETLADEKSRKSIQGDAKEGRK